MIVAKPHATGDAVAAKMVAIWRGLAGVTFNQCPTGLYKQLQSLQNSGTHSDIVIPVTGLAAISYGECN